MKIFHVIQCLSQYEIKIEQEFDGSEICEVYCPKAMRKRYPRNRKSNKFVLESRPLFPRYLFVSILQGSGWHELKKVKGVLGFVSAAGEPLPVREEIINMLKSQENFGLNDDRDVKVKFNKGEKMLINAGVMQNQIGVFQEMSGKLARLEIDCFGRKVLADIPVELLAIIKE